MRRIIEKADSKEHIKALVLPDSLKIPIANLVVYSINIDISFCRYGGPEVCLRAFYRKS